MSDRSSLHYLPHPDVIGQQLEGQLVLVHTGTNAIMELNPTAARFWELLAERVDIAHVKQRLLEEFEVEPATLEKEIAAMLATFLERKLITRG